MSTKSTREVKRHYGRLIVASTTRTSSSSVTVRIAISLRQAGHLLWKWRRSRIGVRCHGWCCSPRQKKAENFFEAILKKRSELFHTMRRSGATKLVIGDSYTMCNGYKPKVSWNGDRAVLNRPIGGWLSPGMYTKRRRSSTDQVTVFSDHADKILMV